jgi:hypothetical protein
MRHYGNVVVIAISAIYSVISMTVATSVVVIMDIIGYKLPVTGEISYAVVMVQAWLYFIFLHPGFFMSTDSFRQICQLQARVLKTIAPTGQNPGMKRCSMRKRRL